jgi:hypothetical protein
MQMVQKIGQIVGIFDGKARLRPMIDHGGRPMWVS